MINDLFSLIKKFVLFLALKLDNDTKIQYNVSLYYIKDEIIIFEIIILVQGKNYKRLV